MQTVTIEFTADELSDLIGAAHGIVHLTESPDLPRAGIEAEEQKAILQRFQLLLAKLTDYIQHPEVVQ